ncbi:signal recognition particle protein [Floccifex sp.]|uniref:signal recognition particle protein n=1 Tax=Floccifex sp. TaxID=2815810 RepID=UPI002A74844F|nr:signal recognition particle protein [Floccifex sp.]MDD7280551.1 signal recognition particle protein [Erysipelotrichaceae bacterium]MDY2959127.1 signal recognition particle protein [Floccifex sp.]
MAFESLSDRLSKAFKNISGQGKLTEKNMNDMLKEVRMSLLEADVNYTVVKNFIENVKEKAMGQEVMDSLNPGQMVVKVVRDELQELLGQEDAHINFKKTGITTVMMVGLQGTGKTTASAKIAKYCKEKLAKRVLLVACDVIRPAAIEQLKTLGHDIDIEVFSLGTEVSALETAKKAMAYARDRQKDLVIFDTAGRLHIDEDLMNELKDMKSYVQPDDILLTVDAMTGQDIVTVAKEFNEKLSITGLIVTKMDGDARGGGLLSVRSITNVPVLFVSNGEKVDDLEAFHPDRMANRILGMGDVISLVEQAEDKLDMEVQKKTARNLMEGKFDFNDLLSQYDEIGKMGSMQKMLNMIPGLGKMARNVDDEVMNQNLRKSRAIIQSMTPYERENPSCLKASRKNRIAKGAGVKVMDVNKLIGQLEQMQTMSKLMKNGMPNMNALQNMQRGGGMQGMSKHSGSKKQKKSKKKKKK